MQCAATVPDDDEKVSATFPTPCDARCRGLPLVELDECSLARCMRGLTLADLPKARSSCQKLANLKLETFFVHVFENSYEKDERWRAVADQICDSPPWPILQLLPLLADSVNLDHRDQHGRTMAWYDHICHSYIGTNG